MSESTAKGLVCQHGNTGMCALCLGERLSTTFEPPYEERLRDEAAIQCLAVLVGRDTFSPEYCASISEQAAKVWIKERRKRKEG